MTFKQRCRLAFCAVVFSLSLLIGGGTAILYIVGETVDTVAEESSNP